MGREKHFWAVHLIFFYHLYDGLTCVCLQTSSIANAMRAVSLYLDLIRLVLVGAFSGCDGIYVRSAFHALEIWTRPTEGDSLSGSSLLMLHRHSSGRKDCSTRIERRSADISIRTLHSSLDHFQPTCFWHLASLKLFFCMQACTCQPLMLYPTNLESLTLYGACSWVTRRIAFYVLLETLYGVVSACVR
jgi:hypothetical protein